MALGPFKIILILFLIMVLFGGSRLPAMGENIAKGIKAFRKGLTEDDKKPSDKTKDNQV